MSQPSMPNIPGMGAMADTLGFVKNLWGGMGIPGMNIPGMVMPSLSVEEINKQIADLKAVESWLTLNMNMLRGTIQALEVQSATISTLQSMSETISAAMTPGVKSQESPKSAYARATEAPAATGHAAAPNAEEPGIAGQGARKSTEKGADKVAGKTQATGPADATAMLANSTAWWNMLQDQFKQAVNTALASEKPEAAVKSTPGRATKPTLKPSGKKPAAPRKRTPSKSAAGQ